MLVLNSFSPNSDSKEGHGTHAQESSPELQSSSSQERGKLLLASEMTILSILL
jgi:hypothetical protein